MIEIFVLSLIQGVAEFLPISSSSHLILISDYLKFENQSLSIDVSLHIGSFLAVIVYFSNDIKRFFKNKIIFYKILLSSLPVMIVGFFLVEFNMINKIRNIETIAWTTFIFGILLYISDRFKVEKNINDNFDYKSVLLIGFMQILSLAPGVSRSGIAITAARLLNFKRTEAAKISFLISIPILGAVTFFGLKNLFLSESIEFTKLNLLSIIISFIFSYLTIKYFLRYIEKFNLNIFVYYRVLLGLILIGLTYL
ncbi:MAG: UDP-diphosphatase [Pelagibacteraceae bacterium]|jgi:undecaprenyl-diphosphatase|nr:UDP-diphosphatase [Pelagibacteraceae bacterium]|tara:strand:- start:3770 stop:4528 length:759 start_codon:yes stop_codon:yes gene_type:complete